MTNNMENAAALASASTVAAISTDAPPIPAPPSPTTSAPHAASSSSSTSVVSALASSSSANPHSHCHKQRLPTIFVSIVSYRDPETVPTLDSIYRRAFHPERIWCGVLWQVKEEEDKEIMLPPLNANETAAQLPSTSSTNSLSRALTHARQRGQVREYFMPSHEARGPVYARAMLQRKLMDPPESSLCHDQQSQFDDLDRAAAAPQCKVDFDFYLQIDSHSRFAHGWDEGLLAEWEACHNPRAILTTYPIGYDRDDGRNEAEDSEEATNVVGAVSEGLHQPPTTDADDGAPSSSSSDHPSTPTPFLPHSRAPILCAKEFHPSDGMLRFVGRMLKDDNEGVEKKDTHKSSIAAPMPSLFYAAGFVCGPMPAARDVPYNPHLPYLFFGEEISMCARLYTHGYDLYAPSRSWIKHCWSRKYRSNFRENMEDNSDEERRRIVVEEERSRKRVRQLLGMEQHDSTAQQHSSTSATRSHDHEPSSTCASSTSSYGLGSVRSLQDFYSFTGIDFARRSISSKAQWGGLDPHRFKPEVKKEKLDLIMQLMQRHMKT